MYLFFRGVNEQAWVYVNGELAFERTYAATDADVGDNEILVLGTRRARR
jgi:hypothetical protein